jgi:hypothetical protein
MPHTSHRKKAPPRRRKEVDEDGWTRVTSGPRVPQSVKIAFTDSTGGRAPKEPDSSSTLQHSSSRPAVQVCLTPCDPTVADLHQKYDKLENTWLHSDSWQSLKEQVQKTVSEDNKISTCLLFGTGSMCGLRNDWIMRHDVAILQTAIFKAVVDTIGMSSDHFSENELAKHWSQNKSKDHGQYVTLKSLATTTLTPHFSLLSRSTKFKIPQASV